MQRSSLASGRRPRVFWKSAGLLAGLALSLALAAPSEARTGAVLVRLRPWVGAGDDLGAPLNLARLARLPDLAARVQSTGALEVGQPFRDLVPAEDPLARTIRLFYPPTTDLAAAARMLARATEVEWAEPDAQFEVAWADRERFVGSGPHGVGPPNRSRVDAQVQGAPEFLPNDPLFVDGSQWGLRNSGTGPFGGVPGADIKATEGWRITTGSTATLLAIVDTGCDLGQPELAGDLADGTPRIVGAYNSSDEGSSGSPWDSVGHGTMVAGVTLARTNNGPLLDGRGVAGVCGGAGGDSAGCRVLAIKATPTRLTDALASELVRGILYATNGGARAINLSFGGDEASRTLREAIEFAAVHGTVVVCGAGNGQDDRPQYPGYYARYGIGISVAGLRSDGTLARFSSRGPQIDVAAPGENIYSTYLTYENAYQNPRRNFEYTSGTSFAAPHVTGLVGLAMTLQPGLIDNEFQEFLRRTSEDAGDPGRDDTFGWGIPNARRLLDRLSPARSFERDTASAQTWALVGTDSITLSETGRTIAGCPVDGRYLAERWEVRAHVTLPPGRFLETPEALVRVHGTKGYGPGTLFEYDADWGEVVPGTVTATAFDVRTYVYRIPAPPETCTVKTPIGWLPVPPEAARIAWSAFGLRDAPAQVSITLPAEDGTPWNVDFADTLRWEAFDPDGISGFDVDLSRDGGATWQRLTGAGPLPSGAREFAFRSPCGPSGSDYRVRVTAYDTNGQSDQGAAARGFVPARECGPGENPDLAVGFALLPITPNPARGAVELRYAMTSVCCPVALAPPPLSDAKLVVCDARGRRVRFYDLPVEPSGSVLWDGLDSAGRRAAPGVYFARLEASGQVAVRRFVFLGGSAP